MSLSIRFKTVTFRNFKSYGGIDTTINLERHTACLIQGKNLDNTEDGFTSNGVGKTTCVDAIVYALYGKPLSKMTVNELINNINKKNMFVRLEFNVGSDEYIIERHRKTSSGTDVFFFKNGTDVSNDSSKNIDAAIENVIGMTYEMFTRHVAFSAKNVSYLSLPAAKQVEIGEELCRLTLLGEKAAALKEGAMKDIKHDLEIMQSVMAEKKIASDRQHQQIERAKARVASWELEHEREITYLEEKKSKLEVIAKEAMAVDFEDQENLSHNIAKMEAELTVKKSDIRSATKDVANLKDAIEKKQQENKALSSSKCPYCQQHYHNEDKLEKVLIDIEALVKAAAETKTLLDQSLTEAGVLSSSLAEMKAEVIPNIAELKKCKTALQETEKTLARALSETNPYLASLDDVIVESVVELDYSEINALTKDLRHLELLVKLLSRKDSFIRQKLLNTTLPALNQKLASRLSSLGLPHHVEFNPDLTTTISQFGREISFGSLSAGQQARVDLALALAFRDVMQELHVPINIGFFDEVLDVGLDAVGVRKAIEVLKGISKAENSTFFIISHKEESAAAFDDFLHIEMKNGFSYVAPQVSD